MIYFTGGTADISAYEKQPDGTLKEICQASGGPWGGTAVDKAFLYFMDEIFGEETMTQFKRRFLSEYIHILRDFESKKKRKFECKDGGRITFRIPLKLVKLYNKLNQKALHDRADGGRYGKKS